MIIITCGILGLLITIANVLIILTLCLKHEGNRPHLSNSQSIYKLSLAVADLQVGVIVLPICIANLYLQVWTRHLPRDELRSVEGFETISKNFTTVQIDHLAGRFDDKFPSSYANFAGFFTAVSIFVSVYVLAGAGFDRLKAISKPFDYVKQAAQLTAIKLCIAFWIIAIIFGILPVLIHELRYILVFSLLFATIGLSGYILYAVCFFIPLVIVWVVNVLTFYHAKRHARVQLSFTEAVLKKRQKIEQRHAATLQLMVGIFTLNTLPLIITLVSPLFIPSVSPSDVGRFDVTSTKAFLTVQFIATLLLLGSSLCNFFIYSGRNPEFRRSLKQVLQKIGKATKISICLKRTTVCCHKFASRTGSNANKPAATAIPCNNKSVSDNQIPRDDMPTTQNDHQINTTWLTLTSQTTSSEFNSQTQKQVSSDAL